MYGHVLVIDDQPWNIEGLRQATVGDLNSFIFVTAAQDALYVLYEYDINHEVELIACNVGMSSGDICQFIRTVRDDIHWCSVPLLCYCVTAELELESLRVVAETYDADELIASSTFDPQVICLEARRWLARGRRMLPPQEFGGYDDFASSS
jgi:CheY-like chemotaxis protein